MPMIFSSTDCILLVMLVFVVSLLIPRFPSPVLTEFVFSSLFLFPFSGLEQFYSLHLFNCVVLYFFKEFTHFFFKDFSL